MMIVIGIDTFIVIIIEDIISKVVSIIAIVIVINIVVVIIEVARITIGTVRTIVFITICKSAAEIERYQ